MVIFTYSDYHKFLRDWIAQRPKQGYGEARRIARHLGVSSMMISQVLQGAKELSLELACELAEFLGLSESEERYFLLLVELARAGSHKLKEKLRVQLREHQERARKISEHVRKDRELSSDDKAVYYSSWIYTAVRNLTAIQGEWTSLKIAAHLQIPEKLVNEVLDFLLGRGLLQLKDRRYSHAIRATHLSADHPLVTKHHQNWRLRGMQKMDVKSTRNTFFTGPLSLSREDDEVVQQLLVETIAKINKIVVDSPSETVRCLNVDWFDF